MGFFLNHAQTPDEDYNVRYDEKSGQGFDSCITNEAIPPNTELIIQYNQHVQDALAVSEEFINGLLAKLKDRSGKKIPPFPKNMKKKIINMIHHLNNHVCVQLSPSQIDGVGVFAMESTHLLRKGMDPFASPKNVPEITTTN